MLSASTSGVDFALVSIILFFIFFLGLVLYLRREDRREGYPLEEDGSGRLRTAGGLLFTAPAKTFNLPGGGSFTVPNKNRDRRPIAARRSVTPGSPLIPTGNPMVDGVGPAAYAERAKVPDMTAHGAPKIVPMRVAKDFYLPNGEADPRGMMVVGADRGMAGTVKDIWVDRAEWQIRYLEVALDGSGQSVLLPITMSKINKSRRHVVVDAITAAQFASVPKIANPDQVTFYEEERVVAYYGGGFLYAVPARQEPLL
ncbi:MAG: photosynthetic reaction center subunit H [Proteobacteria bacterium]|nr:photosynthetic reaction center subunit H [Pseudomonadota bacterium]